MVRMVPVPRFNAPDEQDLFPKDVLDRGLQGDAQGNGNHSLLGLQRLAAETEDRDPNSMTSDSQSKLGFVV